MKSSIRSFCVIFLLSLSLASTLYAQVIEPSIGQSLTITEDVNLAPRKSLRLADTVVLKSSVASLGNLFLGLQAGLANTTAKNNTFLGTGTGLNSNGDANTFVGRSAGRSNTGGQFNTFIGVQAGLNNTTGNSNFIMGTNAGLNNSTGSANFFLGDNAGGGNTTGGFNVYLGANAGSGAGVNGSNNVSIGFESGRGNQNGVNNTFLGFRADAAPGLSNATAIGNNATVTVSDAVVLGNNARVGIGNTAPTARLHVTSGVSNQSGFRLENLTSSSTASINSSKFLTVDGSGNVVLANYISGGRKAADTDVLWQRQGGYIQSVEEEAIIIGRGVSKTPVGYKLFVEGGILAEKIKVAIKNTSDWSDKVFDSGYYLRSLSEVQQYISANKHLPGVPSAADVVEQGIDLAKMNAKLLEKVEELTLYSIQLENKSQKQQADIEELKRLVNQLIDKK